MVQLKCSSTSFLSFHRYMVLVAGIYLMSISGSSYLFATIAEDLQNRFQYSATEIQLIGTLGNIGGWTSVLQGVLYDHYGSIPTSIVGAVLIFVGYFYIYLACGSYVSSNYIAMGMMLFLMGQGSSATYSVALTTNVKNFKPEQRGTIVGILVCFFGLCGGIYTSFFQAFFTNSTPLFILFMAITYASVALICGFFSTISSNSDNEQDQDKRIMNVAFVLALLTAVWIALSNVVQTFFHVRPLFLVIPLIFFMAWFLFLPAFFPPWCTVVDTQYQIQDDTEKLEDGQKVIQSLTQRQEKNLPQAMKTAEFWLVFFILLLSIGSGIVTVNNLSGVVIALEQFNVTNPPHKVPQTDLPHNSAVKTFVALFSVFNTLGRMSAGLIADRMRNRLSTSMELILFVSMMGLTQIYMAFATINMIYLGVTTLGLAYGGIFCMAPLMTSEFFGTKNFAANWGTLGIAPAIGSTVFSTFVAGKISDHFVQLGDSLCILTNNQCSYVCLGTICYRYTYFVTTGACILALLLGIILNRLQNSTVQNSSIFITD